LWLFGQCIFGGMWGVCNILNGGVLVIGGVDWNEKLISTR
jgi:hypothetical protein